MKWPIQQEIRYAISSTIIAIEQQKSLQAFDYQGKLVADLDKFAFQTVLKFEFDDNEKLVVVTPNSIITVNQFSPLETNIYSLNEEIQDNIWDYQNGMLIMQQSQDIYEFKGNSINLMQKNDGQYTLLTKEHWNCNGKKAVLLDINHVFELDMMEKKLVNIIPDSQWHRVVLSPNNFICLYNLKFNKLQVFKEAARILLEHSLEQVPKSIMWCGDDTIACSFTDEVILYGPDKSYAVFWFPDEIAALHTEIDGLKIFTEENVHFISRVAEHTSNIFRVGSTAPSAILLDSLELLEENTARAIENLKMIDLKQAVIDCIEAAKEEFDSQLQKKLLSAATFGKASLTMDVFDSGIFVRACDFVRLLNLLRGLAIYLTLQEYSKITLDGLILRLLDRQEHYKCIMICKLIKNFKLLPTIFIHWGISKVKLSKDSDDDELLAVIKDQYEALPEHIKAHISKISKVASTEGRFNLSRELALLEYSPELKISHLIDLDENSMALKEAMHVECPELTASLLFNLREKLTNTQLAKLLILDMPREQLYPYIYRENGELLYDYYQQADRLVDLAHLLLLQGKQHGSIRTFLPQVQDLYSKILNDPLIRHDTVLLNRQEKLWIFQETLSSSLGDDFLGKTLDQTLFKLIEMRQQRHVQALIKKFKINDKKFYHLKIRALVAKKMFDDLYQFAITKKSPIGYQPFYDYLIQQGHNGEASIYVSMIASISYERKMEMYLKCKAYQEAIQLAGKEKDIMGLKELYKAVPANEPQLKALINDFMNRT